MNPFMAGVARAALTTFDLPEPILEVGSYLVEGQEEVANLRKHVAGKDYVGIDYRSGPGVDSVENVEQLPRPDDSVGTVLAFNVFEHVERFWLGFEEVRRVLRPDGLLAVSCPFHFRVHNHPGDFWRFTPSALESLLQPYPTKIIGYHGPAKRPIHVWAIAAGPDYPEITEEQSRAFQAEIQRRAPRPDSLSKQLRRRLAGVLCGRSLVAPQLESNSFHTRLLRAG
ncbi:MAG: class I SAM-dependent methyltransferase [Planctomycetales bacterium]